MTVAAPPYVCRAFYDVEVRKDDDDETGKTFRFVAATENAVRTPFGVEVLRMRGARLKRYRANPIVLDAHNRSTSLAVIGRGEVEVEEARGKRRLVATVRFASTKEAEDIRSLVDGGFLRAMSIGYRPDPARTRYVREGDEDGDVKGPAMVVGAWDLLELSLTPLPADEEALRRSLYYESMREEAGVNYPDPGDNRGGDGAAAPSGEGQAAQTRPAPAPKGEVVRFEPHPEQRAADELEGRKRQIMELADAVGLREFAGSMLLEDPRVTVEQARQRMLEERKRSAPPVGTPEPRPAVEEDTESEDEKKAGVEHAVRSLFVPREV